MCLARTACVSTFSTLHDGLQTVVAANMDVVVTEEVSAKVFSVDLRSAKAAHSAVIGHTKSFPATAAVHGKVCVLVPAEIVYISTISKVNFSDAPQ